jgi:hypothetical protein
MELHRVSPLGVDTFGGMQWTWHHAGVADAETRAELMGDYKAAARGLKAARASLLQAGYVAQGDRATELAAIK